MLSTIWNHRYFLKREKRKERGGGVGYVVMKAVKIYINYDEQDLQNDLKWSYEKMYSPKNHQWYWQPYR